MDQVVGDEEDRRDDEREDRGAAVQGEVGEIAHRPTVYGPAPCA
jgi:hypothetical protein